MCGIAGLIGQQDYQIGCNLIAKIRHRGPDGDGLWLSPEGEFPVTLCHTRLSILDLSDSGSQPFHSADGRYMIVFNGEIYNFLELRKYLSSSYSIVFSSDCDTEVLLYGLIVEGVDFLLKCNGMWAFCFWDRIEKTAILCRDRFGIKPLYYTNLSNGCTGFSSEMKGLTPLLSSVQPSKYINSIFTAQFNYEFSDICAISGISRLPAGTYAILQNGDLSIHTWWNTLDHLNFSHSSYTSQVECWRNLFIDSVRLRMRSDVRLGTALSGGLDSSSVLAIMSHIANTSNSSFGRIADDWQYGVCATFPGSSIDESHFASEVASSFGIQFDSLEIQPPSSLNDFLYSLAQAEDPYLTIPLPMLSTYQSIKARGISVTLDGHGSDEMFSGYGHLKFSLRSSRSVKEFREILAIDKSTRTGVFSIKEKLRLKSKLKYRITWLLAVNGLFPLSILRSYLSALKGNVVRTEFSVRFLDARRLLNSHPAYRSMDVFSQILYELFHLTILPTLLRNYDRYSMASGLEIRMPFMDWRLVCYTFSIPWHSKLGGSFTKRIQRDALEGYLPDSIRLRRDKLGWNAPAHEWFSGPLKSFIEEQLTSGRNYPYYQGFRSSASKFYSIPQPSFTDGLHFWNSMMPYLWLRSLDTPSWRNS